MIAIASLIIVVLGLYMIVCAMRSGGEKNDRRLVIAMGVLVIIYGALNISQELASDAKLDRSLFWAARWCSGWALGVGLSAFLTGAFGRMRLWKKW